MFNSLLKYIWDPEEGEEGKERCVEKQQDVSGNLHADQRESKTFIGTVTAMYSGYGMIDDEVYFSLSCVEPSATERFSENKVIPKVGDSVEVTAFRKHEMGGWRAKTLQICPKEVHNESPWLMPDDKNKTNIHDNIKEKACLDTVSKGKLAKVGKITLVNRDDGLIDDVYQFKLGDCQSGYLPFKGDWINMKLMEDSFTGQIYATDLKPLREKTFEGKINSVQTGFGYINTDIYFTFTVCEEEYNPRRGDKVCGQAIESSRGRTVWRALSVCPIQDCFRDKSITPGILGSPLQTKELQNLTTDKNGVEISRDLNAGNVQLNAQKSFPVCIRNKGGKNQSLVSGKIHGSSVSQFFFDKDTSKSQVKLNLLLPPGKTEKIIIYCKGLNLGMDNQILILQFDGFQIGREMNIKVFDPNMKVLVSGPQYEARKGWNRYRAVNVNTSTWMVPGQRPQQCCPNLQLPNRLPQYPVPEQLREYFINNDNLLNIVPDLGEELCMDNYTKKFSTLLHLEEIQEEIEMRDFDLERVCLKPVGEYLTLQVPGLAEGRPSVLIGDRVILTEPFMPEESPEYEGFIHEVTRDEVWLKFNQSFHSGYSGQDYNVRFTFNRTTLRRCHQAAEFAPMLGSEVLFPETLIPKIAQTKLKNTQNVSKSAFQQSSPIAVGIKRGPPKRRQSESFDHLNLVNTLLNDRQKAAVYRILNGQSRPTPYILFGPPGTGKTVTLVESILQIFTTLSGSRILACAPSNSASDLLAERLHLSGKVKEGDMARLNAFQRVEGSIPEVVKPYVCNGDNLEVVSRYRILICTCTSAGMMYSLGLKQGHFTHVFVDESGQATEPECMIPIGLVAGSQGQVVLAGDPMQLGPVLRSGEAKNYGLSQSLLERLMDLPLYARNENKFADHGSYDPLLVTKLVQNYRSHAALISLPSELFYHNELIFCAEKEMVECLCKWNMLPNSEGCPFIFHGMRGEDLREGNSPSWFNPVEAVQVMKYLQALNCNTVHELTFDDIGIITPYRKQVEKIRVLIDGLGMDKVKVGSVEEFQGQEKLVIIISTVRSNEEYVGMDLRHNLGFLSNPKRFNVAITRAQALLIIIGNPYVLYRDAMWKTLICYAVSNKAYTGCDLPPLGLPENCEDEKEKEEKEIKEEIADIDVEMSSLKISDHKNESLNGPTGNISPPESPEMKKKSDCEVKSAFLDILPTDELNTVNEKVKQETYLSNSSVMATTALVKSLHSVEEMGNFGSVENKPPDKYGTENNTNISEKLISDKGKIDGEVADIKNKTSVMTESEETDPVGGTLKTVVTDEHVKPMVISENKSVSHKQFTESNYVENVSQKSFTMSVSEDTTPTKLESKIIRQMEYYFSDVNLIRDRFLQEKMQADPGNWVELQTIVTFNKMKALTTNFEQICSALSKSKAGLIEISHNKQRVRRSLGKPVTTDHELWKRQLLERAAVLEGLNIAHNNDQEKLEHYLEQYYGTTEHIERWIPKVKQGKDDCSHLELVIFKDKSSLARLPYKINIDEKSVNVHQGKDYVEECIQYFYKKRVQQLNRYLLKPVRRYSNKSQDRQGQDRQSHNRRGGKSQSQYTRNSAQQGRKYIQQNVLATNISKQDSPPSPYYQSQNKPSNLSNINSPESGHYIVCKSRKKNLPKSPDSYHEFTEENVSKTPESKSDSPLSFDSSDFECHESRNSSKTSVSSSAQHSFLKYLNSESILYKRGREFSHSHASPKQKSDLKEEGNNSAMSNNNALQGNPKAKLWLRAHGMSSMTNMDNPKDELYQDVTRRSKDERGLSSVSPPFQQIVDSDMVASEMIFTPSPIKGDTKGSGNSSSKPTRSSTPLKNTKPLGSPGTIPGIGRGYRTLQLLGKLAPSPGGMNQATFNTSRTNNLQHDQVIIEESSHFSNEVSTISDGLSDKRSVYNDTKSTPESIARSSSELSASEKGNGDDPEISKVKHTVELVHGNTQYVINLKPSKLFKDEGEGILQKMLDLEKANKEVFERVKTASEDFENESYVLERNTETEEPKSEKHVDNSSLQENVYNVVSDEREVIDYSEVDSVWKITEKDRELIDKYKDLKGHQLEEGNKSLPLGDDDESIKSNVKVAVNDPTPNRQAFISVGSNARTEFDLYDNPKKGPSDKGTFTTDSTSNMYTNNEKSKHHHDTGLDSGMYFCSELEQIEGDVIIEEESSSSDDEEDSKPVLSVSDSCHVTKTEPVNYDDENWT